VSKGIFTFYILSLAVVCTRMILLFLLLLFLLLSLWYHKLYFIGVCFEADGKSSLATWWHQCGDSKLSCYTGSKSCQGGGLCQLFLAKEAYQRVWYMALLCYARIYWFELSAVSRYCINYAPFDFVYKFCKFMPIRLLISILKEVQRANKVHYGILFAMKNFPGSHFVIGVFGILKGACFLCL